MNKRVLIPYRHEKKLKNYVQALQLAGLEPVPMLASGQAQLNGAHGLLLAGGTDVNPKLYGAVPNPETQKPDDERDAFELDILQRAMDSDIPVFAICRGLQLLNVYAGGTLVQHLASSRHNPPEQTDTAHEVDIEPGTLLISITGSRRVSVNSYHHQAVDEAGADLRISARDAADGTIEALEHTKHKFVLAVQWHPEDLVSESPQQLGLFQHFGKSIHTS